MARRPESRSRGPVSRLLRLNSAQTEQLVGAAVNSTIKQYGDVDSARGTARWQSGLGLNLALLFGTSAAVLAAIASAGIVAPATAAILIAAAEASGLATGTSLVTLLIGQGRAKTNERVYRSIPERHGLSLAAQNI